MLFLQRILSPFNHSVLSKHALFSISKVTDVESPDRLGAEAGEDCRKPDMIQFLRNDCGLSESQVEAIARRGEKLFKTKSIDRAQQAVQLFRDSGFAEDQGRLVLKGHEILSILHLVSRKRWVLGSLEDGRFGFRRRKEGTPSFMFGGDCSARWTHYLHYCCIRLGVCGLHQEHQSLASFSARTSSK